VALQPEAAALPQAAVLEPKPVAAVKSASQHAAAHPTQE
jgi:hypothetical protein